MSDSEGAAPQGSEGPMARVTAQAAGLGAALRAYAKDLPFGPARHNLMRVATDFEEGRVTESLHSHHMAHRALLWAVVADLSQNDPQSALQAALESVRHYSKRRMRLWRAFAYPAFLLLVCCCVMFFVLGFVTPQFEELFFDFEVELPAATLIIIQSQPLLRAMFLILISVMLISVLIPPSAYDRLLHLLPIVGRYRQCSQIAGFCRSAAALLRSAVSLPTAVERAGRFPGQPVLEAAAHWLAQSIRDDNVSRFTPYPFMSTIVFALTTDVDVPARCALLYELADVYDERADKILRWLENTYEPLLAVFLGIFVGFTVIALLMPLVSLVQNLS